MPKQVISNQDRWRILRQFSSGSFTRAELVQEYGVSRYHINNILSGRARPFISVSQIWWEQARTKHERLRAWYKGGETARWPTEMLI